MSVIVPHYHDLTGLAVCLLALGRQTYPRDRTEVIVADNGSPEGPEAVEAVLAGRARLVVVAERGAGPARNGGVAEATGDVLAFTDSDCLPDEGWIAAGVAALKGADLIGGRMSVLVRDEADLSGPEAFERAFAFDNERYVRKLGFSVTANLFCRAEVFKAVGGFRVGVPEDLDWCQRARRAGYAIAYAPDALVGHPARRTWADLTAKWRRLNREAFVLRTSGGARARGAWLLRSLLLPFSAVAHTPKVLLHPALRPARARLAALTTLYRLRLWRLGDALRLLRS